MNIYVHVYAADKPQSVNVFISAVMMLVMVTTKVMMMMMTMMYYR